MTARWLEVPSSADVKPGPKVSSRGWRSTPRDLTIVNANLLALYTADPMSDKRFRGSVQENNCEVPRRLRGSG